MSNIFSSLKKLYAAPWNVKETRKMNAEEISAVASATVVSGQYGNSVCFVMKNGGMGYIQCTNDSVSPVGTVLDVNNIDLVTLCKQGEADIVRVKC